MTGIVFGWGLALVPLGLVTPLWTGSRRSSPAR